MVKRLILISVLFILPACSLFPNLGKNEEIYGDKSKRIAVLRGESSIFIDHSLDDVAVELPSVKYNNKWFKSSGYHSTTPENIRAPFLFNVRGVEKIGKRAGKGEHLYATPIVANDIIYTIDAEGLVTAFNADNIRDNIWEYQIDIEEDKGNYSNAGMTYSQGRLFIATGYNRIIALNSENGQVIWKRTINSIARSAPAAKDGVVIVNTIDNKIYALDERDGAILWNHAGVSEEISIFGSTTPVIYSNIVFASYSSGELYALNLKNGNIIWYDTLSDSASAKGHEFSDISSPPVVVGSRVFVLSNKGVLIAYDLYSGARLWESDVLGGKSMWYAGNFIYLVNEKSQLLSIHAKNGGVKWIKQLPQYKKPERKLGKYIWNGPVMGGNALMVVGAHGELLSFSPKDGELISTTEVLDGIHQTPVLANDTVFLLTDAAKLAAYKDMSDKHTRTKSLTTPAIVPQKKPEERTNLQTKIKGFFGGVKGLFGGD